MWSVPHLFLFWRAPSHVHARCIEQGTHCFVTFLQLKLSRSLSSEFLTSKSLVKKSYKKNSQTSERNSHKNLATCSVGVLEYIFANLLKMNFFTLRVSRLFMAAYTCHEMALKLSCYPSLHWQNIFPALSFPEFGSVQTIKIVSSKIAFAVLF